MRDRVRQLDPGHLRPREDVDVGRDARGIVERAAPDEPHSRSAVLAEDRDLACGAAVDLLNAAVVARRFDRVRLGGEQLHAVGLDQRVDHEGAAGLPLAVQAVAAVDEHEASRETRAHREEVVETLGDTSLLVAKALAGKSKNRGRQRHALYLALDGRARPRAASSPPGPRTPQ
jgi:hypothetical protein